MRRLVMAGVLLLAIGLVLGHVIAQEQPTLSPLLGGIFARSTTGTRGLWLAQNLPQNPTAPPYPPWFSLSGEVANLKEFGATGNGTMDDAGAFTRVSTALGTTTATLYIPRGRYRIASNVTLASTIAARFEAGAILQPDSGVTVTLNGAIQAPTTTIFSTTGTITLGGVQTETLPQWFGATGDGTTDDTLAIQAALTAGRYVFFPPHVVNYKVTTSLKFYDGQAIVGAGNTRSTIKGANLTGPIFKSDDETSARNGIVIRDLGIDNTSKATVGGVGIRFAKITHSLIDNVKITNVETGWHLNGNANFYDEFRTPTISGVTTGVINDASSNDNSLVGGFINDSTTALDNSGVFNLYSTSLELFTQGVLVRSGGRTNLYSPRIEGGTDGIRFNDAGADYTLLVEPQLSTLSNTYAGNATSVGKLIIISQGQYKFPSVENASTDVNTLDDYEEGTWTPSLGGTTTYTAQTGHYVKVGKLVFVTGQLIVNAIGTGSTSTISGLPFVSDNAVITAGSVTYFASLATNVLFISCYVGAAGNTVIFTSLAAAGTAATDAPAIFGNSARVDFSAVYKASS